MKTSRQDIEIDRKQVYCENSTLLGYSTYTLRKGDMFLYKEYHQDGSYKTRQAISHGRVKPLNKIDNDDILQWFILAESVSDDLQFTYERWIKPEDVIEIIPKDKVNKYLILFFKNSELNATTDRFKK